ncbi:hypothetical protein EMF73_33640, partial [Klebsiella pneumoniae]
LQRLGLEQRRKDHGDRKRDRDLDQDRVQRFLDHRTRFASARKGFAQFRDGRSTPMERRTDGSPVLALYSSGPHGHAVQHGSTNLGPRRAFAVGLVLLLVLLGAECVVPTSTGHGSGAAARSTPALSDLAAGPRVAVSLAGKLPSIPVSGTPYVGSVSVFVTLSLQNQSRLAALLTGLSDPSSPEYHQYLSAREFTAEFSPSA